jgi:hypothetical protein
LQLKLTRITDGKKIIPEIEGLRFVSIVLVILSHIHNNISRVYEQQQQSLPQTRLSIFLEECGAGVNIFFFISGFHSCGTISSGLRVQQKKYLTQTLLLQKADAHRAALPDHTCSFFGRDLVFIKPTIFRFDKALRRQRGLFTQHHI